MREFVYYSANAVTAGNISSIALQSEKFMLRMEKFTSWKSSASLGAWLFYGRVL